MSLVSASNSCPESLFVRPELKQTGLMPGFVRVACISQIVRAGPNAGSTDDRWARRRISSLESARAAPGRCRTLDMRKIIASGNDFRFMWPR